MSDTGINIRRGEVLQTVGGILLTICLATSGWAVTRINANEGRIIRIETKADGTEQFIREIRQDVKEIKERLQVRP